MFVDEAQDNSRVQFQYFQTILSLPQVKGLMIVGDDKQAINGYKGGVWQEFMAFPADRQVCLPRTYRNAPKILALANRIAEPIRGRSPLTAESASPSEGVIEHISQFEEVIPEIQALLKQKRSIMVLSRAGMHRDIALSFLRDAGVPTRSVVVEKVLRVYRAFRDIARTGEWRYDVLKSLFSEGEVVKDGEIKRLAYGKRGVVSRFVEESYTEEDGALYAEYVEAKLGGASFDPLAFGFTEKLLEDVYRAGEGRLPRGVFKNVDDVRIAEIERLIHRYGEDIPSVQVSNIHPIKGAEADVVVLLRDIPKVVADAEQEDEDSERRVWYVAVTRAREKVIITNLREELPRYRHTGII